MADTSTRAVAAGAVRRSTARPVWQRILISTAYIVIPLAVAFVAWELATTVLLKPSPFFPPPSKIFARLGELLFGATPAADGFRADLWATLWRMFLGYAIGVVWGVVVGTIMGRNRYVRETSTPLVEFLRSIPAATTLPLFMILLGPGNDMRVAFIAYGVSWFVIINTAVGVGSIDRTLLEVGVVFRLSAPRRLFRIILPAAMPRIFAGIRIASTAALLLAMLSELYFTLDGLGIQLDAFKGRFDATGLWAVTVVIAIIGLIINSILEIIETRVLGWHNASKNRK